MDKMTLLNSSKRMKIQLGCRAIQYTFSGISFSVSDTDENLSAQHEHGKKLNKYL